MVTKAIKLEVRRECLATKKLTMGTIERQHAQIRKGKGVAS
jgi:hypothetical protein